MASENDNPWFGQTEEESWLDDGAENDEQRERFDALANELLGLNS
jgi:hypothetical protein